MYVVATYKIMCKGEVYTGVLPSVNWREPHTSWKTVCMSVTYTEIMNEKCDDNRMYECHINGW